MELHGVMLNGRGPKASGLNTGSGFFDFESIRLQLQRNRDTHNNNFDTMNEASAPAASGPSLGRLV